MPIPERLALRRMEASLWKERAKLAMDLASRCDDDDPQKLRYLHTAKMLLDRANNKAWRVARATHRCRQGVCGALVEGLEEIRLGDLRGEPCPRPEQANAALPAPATEP